MSRGEARVCSRTWLGRPDGLIDYLPSLLNAGPIQFYSVFISYSTANQDFAERLHADPQARGVRCWFAPHDIQGGKKIHDQIDAAIRVYDRLLLILSSESMSSRWLKTEIEKVREKEVSLNRDVLYPITLVPFSEIRSRRQFNAGLGEDTARAIREFSYRTSAAGRPTTAGIWNRSRNSSPH